MTTTLVTLTGNVADAIGGEFDARRTKVYVRYNTDRVVTDDDIRLGGATVSPDSTGAFTLTDVVASTSLVENLQATVVVDYADPSTRQRAIETFGPYDLSAETGTVDIHDLEEVQALDPTWVTAKTLEFQGYLDDAAELLAQQEEISGLTGEDDAVALLVNTPGSDTEVALSTTFVREGSAFADLGKQAGVDPTGTTECAAAIQTALDAFVALGVRAFAKGTFKIASTVTIAGNADLSDAKFNYTGTTGTAVVVGTSTSGSFVQWRRVALPEVIATAKTTTGWSQVAGTIGVDICNLYDSLVINKHIEGFETNLRTYGKGRGCVYNEIYLGHLDNGKINHLVDASATGWANENLFIGGRLSHNSGELTGGGPTTGVNHIKMAVAVSGVNNNRWIKPSIEGDVPEFHVIVAGGYNIIEQARWEATTPRVKWASDATRNRIIEGYNSGGIVETWVAGATGQNDIRTHSREYVTKSAGATGMQIWENTSSSDHPVSVVMLPGSRETAANTTTAYTSTVSAIATRYKKSTDTYERIRIDHVNGRIYWGNGTALPAFHWYGSSTFSVLNGAHLCFENDNTWDIGAASLRPRDLKLGRNITIGGALDHDGTTAGFFNATPVTKPTALTAANAGTLNTGDATSDTIIANMRTRINELESKLQALGLLS